MRIILIILIGLFIAKPFSGFSQKDSSGIYFTVNDYINQKLSFAINCENQKHKIKADMIFHQKEISVRHNDSTYRYPKDSVYGIKYCDGSIIRIFNNSEYPLINPGEHIQIYKVVTTKNEGRAGTKEFTQYYFSKDEKSNIQELTIYNVKAAFSENHKFHDLIDMDFHNDEELIQYDNFHKIMKINRILQNSLENKGTNGKNHH